jgi:hypothetical protein
VVTPVDDRGRCPIVEVLDALERDDNAAHDQLVRLLAGAARHGPPREPHRSRLLGGGICELKTPRGWRIVYFFDRGRLIVCTELCRKPKSRELRAILARARRRRADYLVARLAGTIVMEDAR